MRKPKVGRKYVLVRVTGDRIDQAEYTRFEDDSVYIEAGGHSTVIEFTPGRWEPAWAERLARGRSMQKPCPQETGDRGRG